VSASHQPPSIPNVDLTPLREGPAGIAQVAREIGAAARSIGFFTVTGHGIPAALVERVFAMSRAFFSLPAAAKEEISLLRSPQYYGYSALYEEQLHPDKPGDLKESFNMGRDLAPDDPDVLAGLPFHGVNQWPALPGFRETLCDYFDAIHQLCIDVHRAIAVDMGVDADYFTPLLDRTIGALRILHYPPHPKRVDADQYGAAPHTDYGNLTFLAQDDVGGLELRTREGQWLPVVPQPSTFVCNIGDCLMRWSNDEYVSTPHRVVNRGGRARYSVAFFGDPNGDAPVTCLPSCTSPKRPPRYEPTTYAEYYARRLRETLGTIEAAATS
jgi:isopenicillin N synthase-like dioxygenase